MRIEDTTFLRILMQSPLRGSPFWLVIAFLVESAGCLYPCKENPLLTIAIFTKRLIR